MWRQCLLKLKCSSRLPGNFITDKTLVTKAEDDNWNKQSANNRSIIYTLLSWLNHSHNVLFQNHKKVFFPKSNSSNLIFGTDSSILKQLFSTVFVLYISSVNDINILITKNGSTSRWTRCFIHYFLSIKHVHCNDTLRRSIIWI